MMNRKKRSEVGAELSDRAELISTGTTGVSIRTAQHRATIEALFGSMAL